jgi:hypothetical protein
VTELDQAMLDIADLGSLVTLAVDAHPPSLRPGRGRDNAVSSGAR